ncbi:hypothetical protein TNCV_4793351 [Trichonephila clavipes]|nr:hypothetical protein TNCV_4793351 [Trichonephila clavipes]
MLDGSDIPDTNNSADQFECVVKMAGRNMRKLTVSEALEYMRQLSENESENDNDEEIVFRDDENVPPDE